MEEIKRNIPRDLFLHFLAVVTLYWSAISFLTLVWQLVDYYFFDALNNYIYYTGLNGPIKFAVSSLIIVFPVFIIVSWYLNKIYTKESQVRESKIRKWLIYFTLFITSLVIISDLVTIINTFLGGEITIRFILKALSVLLVAAAIFGYYLNDVRRESPTKLAKYFAWATSAIVLIAIAGAFFVVGSPATARLIQFDQQKVSDLQSIQEQILSYWNGNLKLPTSLDYLNNPISSFRIPVDPQTGAPYEYRVKDAANFSFELCATFNKRSGSNPGLMKSPVIYPVDGLNQTWAHIVGRVCFSRTIDKQLHFPIFTPK